MKAKERQISSPRKDAEGQFAKSQGTGKAQACIAQGSEKKVKDWDVNYDPAETNEGKST